MKSRITIVFLAAAVTLLALSATSYAVPPPTDGLQVWFKAGDGVTPDGNGNVESWVDQSANGYVVGNNHPDDQTRPEFVASVPGLNNQPALRFDGSGGDPGAGKQYAFLHGPITGGSFDPNNATWFVVGRSDNAGGQRFVLLSHFLGVATGRNGPGGLNRGNGNAMFFDHWDGPLPEAPWPRAQTNEPGLDNQYHVLSVVVDKAQPMIDLYTDGSNHEQGLRSGNQTTGQSPPPSFIQIGGSGVSDTELGEWHMGGDLAEIMIYNRILSNDGSDDPVTNEFNAVGYYLQNKYGLSGEFIEPIPEPSTIALVVSGLLALGLCWRRRKR